MFAGHATVKFDGKFGLIDSSGYFVIQPMYSSIRYSAPGVYKIGITQSVSVCDINGKFIVAPRCEDIKYMPAEQVYAYTYRNQVGYFDIRGNVIYEVKD